ncbi:MAG: response regulator [Candidatus Muiribacteriota bacterium]
MGYKILLVDDSRTQRAVMKKIFGMVDVDFDNIFEAGNGREALKILEKNQVDVIFTDLNMPVMSGEQMLEKLYADDSIKNIPVVIVTSKGSEVIKNEFKHKGVKAYLTKPFTPEQVSEIIQKVVN